MVPAHSKGSADMESGIIFIFLLGIASGFDIYWNVPTNQCKRYNLGLDKVLKTFGIQVNENVQISGSSVTIFYDTQLGLYPKISKSGEMVHGGIPQRGDLEKHLNKARTDLEKMIPSEKFNGLGVIDWESWLPVWEFNWDGFRIYQTESLKFAKELNPTASASEIARIAESQWENSTKSYMLETLRMAKKLRPDALWCYYLFPECHNYKGKKPNDFRCSEDIRKGNDKLSWLWKESTAVCNEIYFYDNHLDRYTLEERAWRDNENMREALRVAESSAKIYTYLNYFSTKLIPKEEMWLKLALTAAGGANGAVIWGASASVASEEHCKNLKQYIIDTLGPAAEKVAWRSNLCSKQVCNGQGRCTFPGDDYAKAWKLFTDDTVKSFYAGDITCRCSKNYSGRFCEKRNNSI